MSAAEPVARAVPCLVCGRLFAWSGRGRWPESCSGKCRTARYRLRAAGKCDSPALHTSTPPGANGPAAAHLAACQTLQAGS